MLNIVWGSRFKQDLKRMQKRNKDVEKLKSVINTIAEEKPLELKHFDHKLIGDKSGCRDCHIEPDWVLIYRTDKETLTLVRTGSHSDLEL